VAALHRAFALSERNNAAVRVRQNLNFDVPGPFQIFFEIQAGVAKRVQGFRRSFAERRSKNRIALNQTHAFAAAARHCFQQYGVAHVAGQFLRLLRIFQRIVGPRNRGNIGAASELAPGGLRSQRFHRFRRRPDERNATVRTSARQRRILRKKSVARMDGVATRAARDI
jgi:hypothetical protein